MRPLIAIVFPFVLLVSTPVLPAANFTQPDEPTAVSDDGTIELEWAGSQGRGVFIVERASTPDFENNILVYEGPDTATFVSGLAEGEYYFRVREHGEQETSSALVVQVQFVSLKLVMWLLGAGLLCLVLLLFFLLRGHFSRGLPSGCTGPSKESETQAPVVT